MELGRPFSHLCCESQGFGEVLSESVVAQPLMLQTARTINNRNRNRGFRKPPRMTSFEIWNLQLEASLKLGA
jgi:hypothetical protein